MLFYCSVGTYIHIASGIYGIMLVGYRDSTKFHKYTNRAFIHYAGLSTIYLYFYSFYGPIALVLFFVHISSSLSLTFYRLLIVIGGG